jgi:ribosomal protection tetracycline resistance protein
MLVRNLNLGIVAHVDAGKTTLTERLLFAAAVIDEVGSVDRGSTQTDSLALERRRGITIKSAVVSFAVDGVRVNLIDTPGHPDFIAEVERALSVLDGAVLVISAVEGVQSQTRVLMRALQRLEIPTLLFVNKIDRVGADDERVLNSVRQRLTRDALAISRPHALGTPGAWSAPLDPADPGFASELVDRLSERDDAMVAAYVARSGEFSAGELRARLSRQASRGAIYPVLFGSAITGAGVESLMSALPMLLGDEAAGGDERAVAGTVFKVERGPAGERLAYLRLFSGRLRTRDEVSVSGGRMAKVTSIKVFESGGAVTARSVAAGQIAVVGGLGEVRIGDAVGSGRRSLPEPQFAPPTLETVVVPDRIRDRSALHVALTQLAEQDPLINLREDARRGEIALSLYGEVQKEVIQSTLLDDFGIGVTFRESSTICIERPRRSGSAVESMKDDGNPFLATVGLRIEPGRPGAGVEFRLEVELGAMPIAFFRAVEDTVRETLRQGLQGWEVADCVVVMTRSGYAPRQSRMHARFDKSMSSTGADFRGLTPLVLMRALHRAGTDVYEPIHRFRLEIPSDALAQTTLALGRLRSAPDTVDAVDETTTMDGTMPAAMVHRLRQELPGLTRGEGVLETWFDGYRPVAGRPPARARFGPDPLDRKRYLLAVTRQRLADAGRG